MGLTCVCCLEFMDDFCIFGIVFLSLEGKGRGLEFKVMFVCRIYWRLV